VRIKHSAWLEHQLDLMQHHCRLGQAHYRMWDRLSESFGKTPNVGDLAPVFFGLTAEAHLNSAFLILNRLVDRTGRTVTIERFLRHAEKAADLFPHTTREKLQEAVAEDRQRLESCKLFLEKVRNHRNEQFVHLSQRLLEPPYGILPAEDAFEYHEVRSALVLIGEILNRYAAFLVDSEFVMDLQREDEDFNGLSRLLARQLDAEPGRAQPPGSWHAPTGEDTPPPKVP
jgi:hypothetical protein